MKSARAGMSRETSIFRIQLYIPAFSLTRRKPLTGAMTDVLQQNGLCFTKTLGAIFKLLINSARWIVHIFQLGYLINK